MLAVAKSFYEFFTSTLNRYAVSVQHVLSMPVVLHAGLNNKSRHMQTNKTTKSEKALDSGAIFDVEHKHDNTVPSPGNVRVKKSIICIVQRDE